MHRSTPSTGSDASQHSLTLTVGSFNEARRRAAQAWGVRPAEVRLTLLEHDAQHTAGVRPSQFVLRADRAPRGSASTPVQIYCQQGDVLLVVDADSAGAVQASDVTALLDDWPVVELDERAIASAVRLATSEPVLIAHLRPSLFPGLAADFAVIITDDGLQAWLVPWRHSTFQAPDAAAVSQALALAGVTYGIDPDAIAGACAGEHDAPLLLARGTPAEPGSHAELEFALPGLEPGSDAISAAPGAPAGAVLVQPGDVLLRKQPATNGVSGRTVRGESLEPLPGQDFPFEPYVGAGTALGANGATISATEAGYAVFDWKQVLVKPPAAARREARRNPNGYFALRGSRGTIELWVDAPDAELGKPVQAAVVRKALAAWPAAEKDEAEVERAVAVADFEPVVVGRYQPSVEPAPDAPCAVLVDGRTQIVSLLPWANWEYGPISEGEARELLAAAGVTYGVDAQALQTLAQKRLSAPLAVARLDRLRLVVANLDEAKSQAAATFGVSPEEVEITVEQEEKLGFLGLGGKRLHVVAKRVQRVVPVDGRFEVQWERGKLELVVFGAKNGGLAVAPEAIVPLVVELVDGLGLGVNEEAFLAAVNAAKGVPTTLATLRPQQAPPDDAPAAVLVTDDGLQAHVLPWAPAPEGTHLAEAEVRALLEQAGVSTGVDADIVNSIAAEPLRKPVIVAIGTPAVPGEPALISWLVDPAMEGQAASAPRERSDGRVDYRDMGGMAVVPTGAVLMTREPPRPGFAGVSVRGEALPAEEGSDFPLSQYAGLHTQVSDDGLQLVALLEGMPTLLNDGKLAVMPVNTVNGDVDFTVGNVSVDGNVVIRGSVKPGFRVHATGSIQVQGEVDNAALLEAGGDIKVSGGVIGDGTSLVRAGGTFQARYLNQARVEAGVNVVVEREVRESTVTAGELVQVNGRVIGGVLTAGKGIVAQTLGGPAGTPTRLRAGWDPLVGTPEQLAAQAVAPPSVVARKFVYPGVSVWISGTHQQVTTEWASTTFRNVEGKITTAPA